MSRSPSEITHQPVFHEPVFSESKPSQVPGYLTTPHPSDSQIYQQIQDLLKKDVVSFPASRLADHDMYPLASAFGSRGADVVAQIQASGQLVFDIIGDSGASTSRDYPNEVSVANRLSAHIKGTSGKDRPAFMFHLGDLVYDFGEKRYYYDQVYSAFRNYAGPILPIPGNHDSFIVPGTAPADEPLKTFMRNFCASAPTVTPEAGSLHRTASTLPGVYYTLDAPFIRVIGLFSNALEDPGVISSQGGKWAAVPDLQLSFLRAQLQRVKADGWQGAVVIATHHPSFSYSPPSGSAGTSGGHGSSTEMLADIDRICAETQVYPHAVLAGHAHNMQRYTRVVPMAGQNLQVPFIVAGASGHHVNPLVRGAGATEPTAGSDASHLDHSTVFPGTRLTLEAYDDTDFGYLRATVTADTLRFDYYLAKDDSRPHDSVTVGLHDRRLR